MKKLPVLCLIAALLISGLSSCSTTSNAAPDLDPDSPIMLEIWHYYNGPQKTAFDNMVTEFNDTLGLELGIVVEAFSQGNVEALSERVLSSAQKAVGAVDLPNIFASYADTAFQVDKLGLLTDLNDYFSEDELKAYRSEFIDEGRFASHDCLSIFPVAKSMELMMMNLTDWNLFADATGATLSDIATIEGVTATAEAYYKWTDRQTAEAGDGKAFFGRDAMANYMIIGCRQLGLELIQTDGDGFVSVHTDRAILRRLWDNYYVPFINGWFSSNGRFRSDEAKLGDIIALVGSSSAVSYFPSEISISDFESYPIERLILPAPQFEGSQHYAVQQGAGMAVVKSDATHEYAAATFLKWFTDVERNIEFAAASCGYLPVKNAALTMESIQPALSADPCIEQTFVASLEQLRDNTMYTPPPFDGNLESRAVLEQSLDGWANRDRAAILSLIEQGAAPADAIAQYHTEENFVAWLDQLTAELEATLSSPAA